MCHHVGRGGEGQDAVVRGAQQRVRERDVSGGERGPKSESLQGLGGPTKQLLRPRRRQNQGYHDKGKRQGEGQGQAEER